MSDTKTYAVMHKESGQFFAGFTENNQPIWTQIAGDAKVWKDQSGARQQALLFTSFGINAQKKPIELH